MKKTLSAIVLAAALAAGCGLQETHSPNAPRSGLVTLSGRPLGVGDAYAKSGGNMGVVLEVDGKKLVAYAGSSFDTWTPAVASSLIDAEINDGDDQHVFITGKYEASYFKIKKLSVEDYIIEF